MNPKDILSKIESGADQGIIYHYSKWPAMLGMVRTTKNNIPCDPYLSIRAYNASFMNDEDECRIGYQSFLDELRKRNVYFGKALSEMPIEQIQKKDYQRSAKVLSFLICQVTRLSAYVEDLWR